MITECDSNFSMRSWNIPAFFFSTLHLFVPTIFPCIHCHYTSYLACYIFPHIYAQILLIVHPFPKKNYAVRIRQNTRNVLEETVTDLSIRIEQVPRLFGTRAVPTNTLARGRRLNGTETWRRRSYQCEHIRLNTSQKIFLIRDIPRRNGNVTHSVNRP